MAALNIKSMDFSMKEEDLNLPQMEALSNESNSNCVRLLLDLAFGSNMRYLDDHEMYLDLENIEPCKMLPFASGSVMARGILDSLMSATFFNASALRLLRQLVTGGASFELEKSLAEGAGLQGGYTTAKSLTYLDRVRVEEIALKKSSWARFARHKRFGDLFTVALKESGTLCLGIYRLLEESSPNNSVRKSTIFLHYYISGIF